VHLSFGNCSFFHNNFVDNTIQVYIFNPNYGDIYGNIWDDGYPSGGNYWSDFLTRYPSALEIDASGLWDTPYVIDSNNTDQISNQRPNYDPRVSICSRSTSARDDNFACSRNPQKIGEHPSINKTRNEQQPVSSPVRT
jgi:hypothetical protein